MTPFRPNIEPDGFSSAEELVELRKRTLDSIAQAIKEVDLWVFTLGLTEAWHNSVTRCWYPMCPGTVAGAFVESLHKFHNFSYPEIREDMTEAVKMVRRHNPNARFLLMVSPVPLTATASGNHVLAANEYSKSTLRAVAEDLKTELDGIVDYFPSYEIVTSHPFKGIFFQRNMRTVSPYGVAFVMNHFFSSLRADDATGNFPEVHARATVICPSAAASQYTDPACEEVLLEHFGQKSL